MKENIIFKTCSKKFRAKILINKKTFVRKIECIVLNVHLIMLFFLLIFYL